MKLDTRLHIMVDAKLMRLLKAEAKRKRQSVADVTRSAIADHLMRKAIPAAPVTLQPTEAQP